MTVDTMCQVLKSRCCCEVSSEHPAAQTRVAVTAFEAQSFVGID